MEHDQQQPHPQQQPLPQAQDNGDRVLAFIAHLNQQNADSAVLTSRALENLSRSIQKQSLAEIIKNIDTFNGEQKNFRKWMQSIEVAGRLNHNLSEEDTIRILHETCSGPVADYIFRKREADVSLEELKEGLRKNFSAVTDKDQAWALFKNCRQKDNETVSHFAERLCSLHTIAWEGKPKRAVDEARDIFERELIMTFTSGLKDKEVRRALMKHSVDSFNEAVDLAVDEANITTRLESSGSGRREEPMDLSHIRNKPRCPICLRYGHTARECRRNRPQQQQPPPQVNYVGPYPQQPYRPGMTRPPLMTPPHAQGQGTHRPRLN